MVYISRVYTKFGDAGRTMLADGATVDKDSPRVRAYGEVDELNAVVGLVRLEISRAPHRADADSVLAVLDRQLATIQQELFNLGAGLATPSSATTPRVVVEDRHVERLESELDAWNDRLPPLRSFVLPGG